MLGTVIGIAVLPVAIREMAESQPDYSMWGTGQGPGIWVQLPRGMFKRYDIVQISDGKQFYMIEDTEGVCVTDSALRLHIEPVDRPVPVLEAIPICSAMPA
jgi:hypothetical protein